MRFVFESLTLKRVFNRGFVYAICLCGWAFLLSSCAVEKPESSQNKAPIANSNLDSPLGLWAWAAQSESHRLRVIIEKKGNQWTAKINSKFSSVSELNNEILVETSSGQRFEGRISADNNHIIGYWQQPESELAYSNMVTPVQLNRTEDNKNTSIWSGNIQLQPRPFHVFLDIFKTDNDEVNAVFRNPERNEIMGATRFAVSSIDDSELLLTANRGKTKIEVPVSQLNNDTLLLSHSRFQEPLKMTRATSKEASRYYSSRRVKRPRQYHIPQQLNDGWSTLSASEVDFDITQLNNLIAKIANSNPRNRRPNFIHSLLIAHKGHLVFEEYFYGYDRESVHDTRSIAKVFGSVMVGAMQQQGHSISPQDKPIRQVFRQAGKQVDTPQKQDITLAHLMTYTSGLDCDVVSSASPGNENNMWQQQSHKNFWLYTAKLPLIYPPGERYAYCSGSSNLVGASISAEMNMPVYEAFHKLIAGPLQFGHYHWNLMPNGEGYLGGGVYMLPRDILKVGALYTTGGTWHEQQIISREWIDESTSTKVAITAESAHLSEETFSNNYFGGGQAYIWRTDKVVTTSREYESYEATGNGGQILLVVPELDLAVVMTGGNYSMGFIWGKWRNEIVGRYVIPALVNQKD